MKREGDGVGPPGGVPLEDKQPDVAKEPIGGQPAGGCPFHGGRSRLLDPQEHCDETRRIIAAATQRADFDKAKAQLAAALQVDSRDPDGEIHYLFGVACFHQQDWPGALNHLAVAVARGHRLAKYLHARAETNLKTGIERDQEVLPAFNPGELLLPPALSIREPELNDKSVPASEKRGPISRLLSALLTVGTAALVGVVWFLRDRKPTFEFESWDRRSTLRGLLELGGRRHDLNEDKLHATYQGGLVGGQSPGQRRPAWTERFRTATGAWTTDDPMEGAAGTEIQRSGAPLDSKLRDSRLDALPSAREVSRRILAPQSKDRPRQEVPFLNLLTIAWIQAQLHDWVSHKPTPVPPQPHAVPLGPDDPLRERYCMKELRVQLSVPNPMPNARPQTYLNEVTHWWDASHIYGSDQETQDRLRSERPGGPFLADGKMRLDGDLLPLHPKTRFEDSGFTRNWWIGLSLIHTLFVKHHNYICDELLKERADKPAWTSDELFHTARLINSAIMAKIHTVEWTPAVLPNAKLNFGMATNWWGMLEALKPVHKRELEPRGEPVHHVIGGIAGGECDNAGKPYAMTEEFTEVYRLHAGVPDAIQIPPVKEGEAPESVPTDATRGDAARAMLNQFGMARLLNSFGHQHMPALVNNNYPHFMCDMSVHGQPVIDIGTIDILRARERGVPGYNDFRKMLGLKPIRRFEELGCSAETVKTLEELYPAGVDQLDLLAGTSCELWRPENFGFGETMFNIFIQMASRRLHADPFYTDKLNEHYYTRTGMRLIEGATFKRVLLRHYPALEASGLGNVQNAFEPWGTTARTHPHEHPLEQIVEY